jgi:peptidoglycan/xylan/chitin deacetylase (PgdA/CDA1 family)
MMRVPGRKLVRRALRPLARSLFPGAVVIGYHRVAGPDWDPLGLAVRPDHFASQVEVLTNSREIVSLGTLAARHAARERLARFAVLTFDDGYRDFADTALPIMEALGVPATVFVATGFTGQTFWWDDVAALLAPGTERQATLDISTDGDKPWRFSGLDQPEQRAATARAICNRLACGKETEIRTAIAQLRAWAGSGHGPQPDGAAMSRQQLEALARHPLVEIGAHTVSHGCLAQLAPAVQRAEIAQSKAQLEALAGREVSAFSYPNGSYSADTPRLVETLGFACACTSMEGACSSGTDRYRIPRVWAPDAPAPDFRRRLSNWANGLR